MNYLYMTVDLSAECPYKRKGGMSVPYPLFGIGDLFLYYPVVGYVVCPAQSYIGNLALSCIGYIMEYFMCPRAQIGVGCVM